MLESELVSSINNYLEKNGVRYSNELRMGIGIPDITLNLGANYRLKTIDDYFLLSILSFIEKKRKTSFNEIKEGFLLTIEQVKQRVFMLANMSLVKIKNHIIFAIKNILSTKLGTTISIEAKLKDWKSACLQAQRYLLFSDYSYVAMPAIYIKNVDVSLLSSSGVGLLSVDDKQIVQILPAKLSQNCDFMQKYLATSKIIDKYTSIDKRHLRNTIFTPLLQNSLR